MENDGNERLRCELIRTGIATNAILTLARSFGKGRPLAGYAGRISSVCGARGVTSGPASPQCMLTSLRTPNSPGR